MNWIDLPEDRWGRKWRVLPAWLVIKGSAVNPGGISIQAVWVTKLNRTEGWARYRYPNLPYDLEREARFDLVHLNLEEALVHASRILNESKAWEPNLNELNA